jgi:hypothetical protein
MGRTGCMIIIGYGIIYKARRRGGGGGGEKGMIVGATSI